MTPGKKDRTTTPNGGAGKPSVKAERVQRAPQKDLSSGYASESRIRRFANRSGRWVGLAAVLAAITVLVTPNLFYQPVPRQVGQPIEQDIEAVVSFSVVDEEEQQRRIDEEKTRARQYYTHIENTYKNIRLQQDELLREARAIAALGEISEAERERNLIQWSETHQGLSLSPALARQILAVRDDPDLPGILDQVFESIYANRGVVDDLERYRNHYEKAVVYFAREPVISQNPQFMLEIGKLADFLRNQYASGGNLETVVPARRRSLVAGLVELYARPNVQYLPERTHLEREKAIKKHLTSPPLITFRKGDIVVGKKKNGTITRQDFEHLQAMNREYARTFHRKFLAIALYIALMGSLVFYYVRSFRTDIRFTTGNVLLVALPVVLALALSRLLLEVARSPAEAGYAFPAGMIGILTVILLDARTGILLVTIGSLAFGVATGLDFKILLVSLLGGYAAVTTLTTAKQRIEVLKAGLIVGIVNSLVILLINFIDDPTVLKYNLMFWGLGNGIVCGALSMPVLVAFESLFGVVTDIRLLELTGLDHPLLKELEEKAPGSYQHSLNVCKLAEAAAKDIGANYLLVRAGSYYHDVGKILKPKYFSENQITLDDKSLHGRISPYMSAMVIKNHVKAGMDLARQYHIPEKVIDFIPQHQGTTIITYFYHEALKRFENSESTDPVREVDFRYPGPKPQSIETAIVMLADAVEATVTSRFTSLSINEDELRLCVKKTIADKFDDGQFDECDLTLRDLHQIRESFVKTLLGRFHHRIAYPTTPGLGGPAAPTARRDRLERQPSEFARNKQETAARS